jgi:hypothetical protein
MSSVVPEEPELIDLIRQLRQVLGMFAGAMPITPQEAWMEALARVRELYDEVYKRVPADSPQIASLRAYVEKREHADHDTFSCGRGFAEVLLSQYDHLVEGIKDAALWTNNSEVCKRRLDALLYPETQ